VAVNWPLVTTKFRYLFLAWSTQDRSGHYIWTLTSSSSLVYDPVQSWVYHGGPEMLGSNKSVEKGECFLAASAQLLESLEVGEGGDNVPQLELACYVHVPNEAGSKLPVEKSPAAATRLALVSYHIALPDKSMVSFCRS
jgi:hypothetical protein